MTHTINCRAKVAKDCYDGKPALFQFGEDLPQDEDGTYEPLMGTRGPDNNPRPIGDTDDGTIVCDPCYIALMPQTPSGRGLNHELDAAIERYRARHGVKL